MRANCGGLCNFATAYNHLLLHLQGDRARYRVTIPLPQRIFARIPSALRSAYFSPLPMHINVGINHESFFAYQMNDCQLEVANNRLAARRMQAYLEACQSYCTDDASSDSHTPVALMQAAKTLELLHNEMARQCERNTNVLRLTCQFARQMHTVLVVGCKSGKDRTGMAVTLEVRFSYFTVTFSFIFPQMMRLFFLV